MVTNVMSGMKIGIKCGSTFDDAASLALSLARFFGITVAFEFNDWEYIVDKDDTIEKLRRVFWHKV
jgi:hypothetical protein